jgi:hypothetical protein
MLIATVFLLDIIGSNSLRGPVRELRQDNRISNQINHILLSSVTLVPHVNSSKDSEPLCLPKLAYPLQPRVVVNILWQPI